MPPQRNVSQIRYKEVVTLFRLKRDRQPVFNLRDSGLIPVSKHLDRELEDIKSLFADPLDKETPRLRLNEILKKAVPGTNAWTLRLAGLFCTLDTDLTVVVKHECRFELLNSNIDYSIWNDIENISVSPVVARVRAGAFDAGLEECLAYLGKLSASRSQANTNSNPSNNPKHPEAKLRTNR